MLGTDLRFRYGTYPLATAGWSSWYTQWHSGNDGSSSGLDADMTDGLHVHNTQGTQNSANQILRTQANGYSMLGWIHTTSGSFTTAMDRIYCSNDGYIRYQTPSNFGANISQYINYNNIANKPTIPVVGTANINIVAGTGLTGGGSFSANQSNNTTITLNATGSGGSGGPLVAKLKLTKAQILAQYGGSGGIVIIPSDPSGRAIVITESFFIVKSTAAVPSIYLFGMEVRQAHPASASGSGNASGRVSGITSYQMDQCCRVGGGTVVRVRDVPANPGRNYDTADGVLRNTTVHLLPSDAGYFNSGDFSNTGFVEITVELRYEIFDPADY
jgi:hypothetical protein